MKKIIPILMMAGLIISFSGCESDASLDDLQLSVANNFFDTYVTLVFVDAATGSIITTADANPIQVTFSGPNQSMVMTDGAKRKNQFTVGAGLLAFTLDPYAKIPSSTAPVSLIVSASCNGHLPLIKQISLYETGIHKIYLTMIDLNQLPEGVTHQKTDHFNSVSAGKVVETSSIGIPGTDVSLEVREGTVLKTSSGTALNGPISAELTHYDTRAADPNALFPGGIAGDYVTAEGSVKSGFISVGGWIDIEIKDDQGHVASQVESGTIGLTLPVNPALYFPTDQRSLQTNDPLKLMSFDPATARWQCEADAIYHGEAMTVELPHLSSWSLTSPTDASNVTIKFTSEDYDAFKSYFGFNFTEGFLNISVESSGLFSQVLSFDYPPGFGPPPTSKLPDGNYRATFSFNDNNAESVFNLPGQISFTIESGDKVVEVPLSMKAPFSVLHGTLTYKKTNEFQESVGGGGNFRFRVKGSTEWREITTGRNGELTIQMEAGDFEVQVLDGDKWYPDPTPQIVNIPEDRIMRFDRIAGGSEPLDPDLLKSTPSGVTLTLAEMQAKAGEYIDDMDSKRSLVSNMLDIAKAGTDNNRKGYMQSALESIDSYIKKARSSRQELEAAAAEKSNGLAAFYFTWIGVRLRYVQEDYQDCLKYPTPAQNDPSTTTTAGGTSSGTPEPLEIQTSKGVAKIKFQIQSYVAPAGWTLIKN